MTDVKTKITVRCRVVVKRATVEFALGMGVGVLATQDVTFTVPEDYSPGLLGANIDSYGRALLEDSVELQYEVIK